MKKQIGNISVDTGLCWIGDPSYILHRDDGKLPKALQENWIKFINKLGEEYPTMHAFNHDMGYEGLGMCVSTGYGDGLYPVFADIVDGRIKSITINFF